MPTIDELRTRVEHSYERLRMPSWPDPHPDMASPRDEEYSRVTEPGRYDIVHARARVWAEKLSEVPGVELERFTPTAAGRQDRDRFDRGFRITSSTPGTLPLLLLEQNASDDEPTVPSLRMVVDVSDWDASTWQNLTGQSGHAFHEHYRDQAEDWATGEQYAWGFSPEAVDAAVEDTLTLTP